MIKIAAIKLNFNWKHVHIHKFEWLKKLTALDFEFKSYHKLVCCWQFWRIHYNIINRKWFATKNFVLIRIISWKTRLSELCTLDKKNYVTSSSNVYLLKFCFTWPKSNRDLKKVQLDGGIVKMKTSSGSFSMEWR